MAFDLFDDVLLLDFALEPTKGVFYRLALLNPYFCQAKQHLQPIRLMALVAIQTFARPRYCHDMDLRGKVKSFRSLF